MSKASDYRNRRAKAEEPTGEIELPSGAVFTMRRPPLQVWVAAGKIPQSFLVKARAASNTAAAVETLSDEEAFAAIKFIRDAIQYACVSPRLVLDGKGDDELDPADLDPEDFQFLSKWVMTGSPGVPVATEGGEVAVDDLAKFRRKGLSGPPVAGPDSESDEHAGERTARASG